MTLSPWWLVALVVPVLALGHAAVARVGLLRRLDLPPVIVGGLAVALFVLTLNLSGYPVQFAPKVASAAWLWPVLPETQLAAPTSQPVFLPLSTAFFACVGLLAGWGVARQGSWQIAILLLSATTLGACQNFVGETIARAMHAPPALGVACGSLTLTGGPSTALGRVDEFERAGLPQVQPIAFASAMFGIVTASVLAAAVGGQLVRAFRLAARAGTLRPVVPDSDANTIVAVKINGQAAADATDNSAPTPARRFGVRASGRPIPGWFGNLSAVSAPGARVGAHLAVILLCVKAGAWLGLGWSVLSKRHGWPIGFPVYMGALVAAIVVRNVTDAFGWRLIRPATVDALSGIFLRLFLAMAISGLTLIDLKHVAGPMAVILPVQALLSVLFCVLLTWPAMGRDYDAAVMATGHVGFGLGITPNAVASMDALTDTFGPAPRAVLVVTIVGGFLIDVTNTVLISLQLPHAN